MASGRFTRTGKGSAADFRSAKHVFRPGDILFGKLRSYLNKGVLVDDEGLCTTELLVLRPKAGVDPRFIVGVFHAPAFVEFAVAGTTGVQHPRTSWSHIAGFELPALDAEEQSKIAHLSWLIHVSIAANEQATEAGPDLKHTAMRTLFTRGLRGEAVKETEVGPIPESWDLLEFCVIRERLQYGTSTRCIHESTPFPVLRIPNIYPGRINTKDVKFGTLSADQAARYRLENGDLLFIRTNGAIERLGACAVFADNPRGALFASYLIRARLRRDRINPYFAAIFFGSELCTDIIAGRATPASDGKYNLNTGTIDGLPIPLPPTLEEQNEIVAVLEAIDRKIDEHRLKSKILDEVSKAQLHKLMAGEIRAADLDLSALHRAGATHRTGADDHFFGRAMQR